MPRCYVNPNPIFQPAMSLIAAITNSNPAVVTTTANNNYITNTVVRLDIPYACGMQQANGLVGTITVTSPTVFIINIDTTLFDVFAIPVGASVLINICAMVVPIGEDNSTLQAATVNTLNPFH